MKKTGILLIILIFLNFFSLGAFADDGICVMYRGEKIEFDVAPYYSNGRIMAPVRAVHEALGAQVSWDDASQTATSDLNGLSLKMTLGDSRYFVNEAPYAMDAAVEKKSDRIFAPVRYVAQGFGKKISYHDYSRTAVISDDKEYGWYTYLTEPVPDFSCVQGAELVSETVLSDGTREYFYTASENSLSEYLNCLQLDFAMEPYGMDYVAGGVSYIYSKDDMLVSITELISDDERKIKLIPDAYGSHTVADETIRDNESKKDEAENPLPEILPQAPLDEIPPEKPGDSAEEKPSEKSISYDDVDYGKITNSKLLEQYTNEGKTFYVYSYDIFSESYYESYIESQGWSFYDFRFDIDSFSNSKYWVKGENMICVSINHMYNVVIICVM
ncbi:MAG: copper amine oxidase N-terminal domain-containing protein [Clostridia bacterium]|nr:copper amine oxidase N-terminal domain-containing protein [Clostridia bacterium]